MGDSVLVKKYSNRRLYDTKQSRYITLEELAELVRAGADARVVDAKTGDDLTQATLTQIIIESRGGARMLPVPLLLQLIRLGDTALAEFLGRYLSWALEMYLQLKDGAQTVSAFNPLATLPFSATNALARLLVGVGGLGSTPTPPPPRFDAVQADELAELRREIDALKRGQSQGTGAAANGSSPAPRRKHARPR
jgi:polyhydroxyalkanoate synthesis repressor PhaR